MQFCHNCSFNLHCFTPSLLLTPSSNDTALPELSAGYVSPGVWIFYKCNCHIHMLLVQTEQVPLLWEVQKPSLKVETTQRPGQSALCQIQSLTRDATGYPKLANFTLSPSGGFKSIKWQIGHGLYLTYFIWCLLRRGAVLLEFLCDKQFHN